MLDNGSVCIEICVYILVCFCLLVFNLFMFLEIKILNMYSFIFYQFLLKKEMSQKNGGEFLEIGQLQLYNESLR